MGKRFPLNSIFLGKFLIEIKNMSLPCGQVSTLCVFESETLDQPMFFENIYCAKLTLLVISNRYYKLSIAVGQQPAKTKVHSRK